MAVVKLLIAFDGTNYHGWQRQKKDITIQQVIEEQLTVISKKNVQLHGAGRTDAGVHADGMVAHFSIDSVIHPVSAYVKGLNSMLPKDIRILDAEKKSDSFHSRFSALGKTYRYDFFTGAIHPPSKRLYSAHCPGPFNNKLLLPAIKHIVGTHDFSSFEHAGSRDLTITSSRGAVRTIYKIDCQPDLQFPGSWSIRVTGDGFLRQMVRILSGTLIEIGLGKRAPDAIGDILIKKDRTAAGLTAPACGLFLEKIFYRKLFNA
jgi:tRNA pseudouridine38-40 synthase